MGVRGYVVPIWLVLTVCACSEFPVTPRTDGRALNAGSDSTSSVYSKPPEVLLNLNVQTIVNGSPQPIQATITVLDAQGQPMYPWPVQLRVYSHSGGELMQEIIHAETNGPNGVTGVLNIFAGGWAVGIYRAVADATSVGLAEVHFTVTEPPPPWYAGVGPGISNIWNKGVRRFMQWFNGTTPPKEK